MKKTTTLSISSELIEEMKKNFHNMSEVAEKAFREKLNKKTVEVDESVTECDFCKRPGEKATRFNLKGLTWLYPDERWICSGCLRVKSINQVAQ